jgi:tetratricopeptide (TPR) repeat protein
MKSAVLFSIVFTAALSTSCAKKPQQKEAIFLAEGRKHLQTKDFDRAILDFRNAIQAMPNDSEAHYQLGLAYLESGNGQGAAFELMSAVKLDPKNMPAQLKLSEMMALNSDPAVVEQARKKAQEVLAASPNNADALESLALAELRLEESGDAVEHLQKALEAAPQHLNASMTLALVKLRDNDQAGAEEVMLKSVAGAPRSAEHVYALGRFYNLIRKPEDAEKAFRKALELDPKYGPALIALANLLYRTGRMDEAGQWFERASALPGKQYRPLHAIFLFKSGKSDAAIAEFERLYKADLKSREDRTRLISAYFQLGRRADAEKVLTDALKTNPNDTDALTQRAELNVIQGKYKEAETDLTEVLRNKPNSPEAHAVMAKVHEARGNSQRQLEELTEALRLNPKALAVRVRLANALTRNNAAKRALEVLDQTPGQDKQSLAVIAERNTAWWTLGDLAEMRKGIDQGLAISRTPALLLQDGMLKLREKDYQGGRASLEELLKQSPEEWKALDAIAISYVEEKKMAEGTAVVRQHTSQMPKSAAAQLFLATWLFRTGDKAGARAAFQAAKSLAPNSAGADLGLAQLDANEGKLESARGIFTAVVAREPLNIGARLGAAQIDVQTGRTDEAIDHYERILQMDSGNAIALNDLAYLLADTGKDPDRALMLAQKVKAMAPGNLTVEDTIGWAYYKKGLYRASLDYLGKAADGGTPRRKVHLAMAYIQTGDRQKASALVQAALKEDPSLPEARLALQLLSKGAMN